MRSRPAGACPWFVAILAWLVGGQGNYFAEFWATWCYFVGPSELALRTLMSVIGAYGAVRAYVLAREFLGPREARLAGWLMACWPSLIGWSAQGLRDSLLIWFWCEVGLGVIRISRQSTAAGAAGLALSLYGLSLFRPYAAVLAAVGAGLALLIGMLRSGRLRPASLLGLLAIGGATIAGNLGFLGAGRQPLANLDTIETVRVGFEDGSTSFGGGTSLGSYGLALLYLPLGLAYFLLAPFPWQMRSAPEMAAILEQPFWYALVALAIYGLFRLVSRKQPGSFALLALSLPGLVFYTLAMTNVGTILRDRAQFTCFVFIYGAHGYVCWQTRRAARRSRRGDAYPEFPSRWPRSSTRPGRGPKECYFMRRGGGDK